MRIYPDLTVDEEFEALGVLGNTGTLNDRQFSFLRRQGFTNSLTDMMLQYLSSGPSSGVTWDGGATWDSGVFWS